jgi:hypothetical protein
LKTVVLPVVALKTLSRFVRLQKLVALETLLVTAWPLELTVDTLVGLTSSNQLGSARTTVLVLLTLPSLAMPALTLTVKASLVVDRLTTAPRILPAGLGGQAIQARAGRLALAVTEWTTIVTA